MRSRSIKTFKTSIGEIPVNIINDSVFGEFPQITYKYRNWSDINHRRLISLGNIYRSCLNDFNDPFDSAVNITYELLKNDIHLEKEYWTNIVKKEKPNYNQLQVSQEVSSLINEKRFHDDSFLIYQNQFQINILNNMFGIFSTSALPDNILMWSHYANNHKGFCVGFDTLKLFDYFKMGGFLKYQTEYPVISPLQDGSNQIIDILTKCKATCWDYEIEYRLWTLIDINNPRSIKLDKKVVKEIIFGCNISKDDREEIMQMAKLHYPHASLFDAKPNKNRFKLDLIPV